MTELRLPPLPLNAQKAIQERLNHEDNVTAVIQAGIDFEYITPFRIKAGHHHLWPGTGKWRSFGLDNPKDLRFGVEDFIEAVRSGR